MTSSKKTATSNTQDDAKTYFNDVYAEHMLVTGMVNFPEYIPLVRSNIPGPEVFMDEPARISYETIMELYDSSAVIKALSVFQRLRANSKWEVFKHGNLSFSYNEMMPKDAQSFLEASEGLFRMYRRYHAFKLNEQLFQMLKSDEPDEQIKKQIDDIATIMHKSVSARYEKTSAEAVEEAWVKIEENEIKFKNGNGLTGINTGSEKLNKLTGGWQKDQVIVLAGRTAMGKTSAALDFLMAAAEDGNVCGFISMEMGAAELQNRLIGNLASIPYARVKKGEFYNNEKARAAEAKEVIAKLKILYIDDVDIKDVKRCALVIAEWKRKFGLDFLIIDYLQYLDNDELRNANDTARVTAVMKEVKNMNRRLQIPIMALAQLSRATEGRGDPRPVLADLKDSGQIEQDASIVIGLFNPVYYIRQNKKIFDELEEGEVPFEDNAYIYYILKFRDGQVCRVDRYANLAMCRFSDYKHLEKSQTGQLKLAGLKLDPAKNPEQQAHDFRTNKVFDNIQPDSSFLDNDPNIDLDANGMPIPPF